MKTKPLAGIRVLDLSALGPGPFGSRLLADYGADVVAVEPPAADIHDAQRMMGRNKKSIIIDLKAPGAVEFVLKLVPRFDVLIESMRPGKMEALGLGPEVVTRHAPQLIYARLTAFGQTGPLSARAGHDINALAIGGGLGLTGLDQPLPPGALLGDFAGGGVMIAMGVLLALIQRQRGEGGNVIDVSMSDGVAQLVGGMLPLLNRGQLGPRGTRIVDGSRLYYGTYRCADGKWLALGAVEPQFFRQFLRVTDLSSEIDPADQFSDERNAELRAQIADRIKSKTRDEWMGMFGGLDACVSPVLEVEELAAHPHHKARHSIYGVEGQVFAGVAPRLCGLDVTPDVRSPAKGEHTLEVLTEMGLDPQQIQEALNAGIVRQA